MSDDVEVLDFSQENLRSFLMEHSQVNPERRPFSITKSTIDGVDKDFATLKIDGFIAQERASLKTENKTLDLIVTEFFSALMQTAGKTSADRFVAGILFANRILRESESAAGIKLEVDQGVYWRALYNADKGTAIAERTISAYPDLRERYNRMESDSAKGGMCYAIAVHAQQLDRLALID